MATVFAGGCARDPETQKTRFVESGDAFLKAGKVQEAIVEYRNAVQVDPRFGKARAKLAAAYQQAGDVKALGEYIRAADLLPEDAELQLTAGGLLMAVGRINDAQARAEAVLKGDPNNVAAHILRGNAFGGLNDLDTALNEMEEAIRLDPARGASYTQLALVEFARGREPEAEAAFKRAVELSPSEVASHLALANFHWASGRLSEAEKGLNAALAIDPKHDGANRAMAVFALSTGRIPQAETYLKRLAENAPSASSKFALAEYYIAAKRTADAIAVLQPMKDDPRTASGVSERLARAYALSGDRSKAYELVDANLKSDPKSVSSQLLKGQLLLEDGKRDEALASVKAAVAAEPTSAAAHYSLGKVYAARGDVAGAEAAFREVLKLNPGATAAQVELSLLQLGTGSTAESLNTAEAAVRVQPRSIEARLVLVRSLLAAKEFARAQKEISALVEAQPNHPAVHVQRGVLAASRNDLAGARAGFNRALELDPQALEAMAGLVALDLNARDFAAARTRMTQWVDKGPVTPALLLLAARTYGSANDLTAAEQTLRRVIELEPTTLAAYSMLGQVFVSQGKLDAARQEFDRLAQKQSKPIGALTMSGIILQAQGQLPQARERFERAVALDPGASVAANNLSYLYIESGEKLDQALRLAQTAADRMPESPEVLDTLGWAYFKNDLPALAIPPLMRSIEKDPRRPVYHYHLGLAYAKSGDSSNARRSLGRALELGRDQPWSSDARKVLASLTDQSSR